MNLTVQVRDKKCKGAVNRARKDNRIPGILYGRGFAAQPVEVDNKALQKALLLGAGDSHLIDLMVETKSGQNLEKALIKAIQRHPVTDRVEHIDFYRVVMTEKIEVEVPLVLTGVPIGIKQGGVLEKRLNSISVRCLPAAIPENFLLDVSPLDVGSSLHVSALKPPEGVAILTAQDQVLVVVTEVKVEEAAPVAAVAAAAPEAGAAAAPGAVAGAPAAEGKDKKPAGAEAEKKEGAKEKPKGKG